MLAEGEVKREREKKIKKKRGGEGREEDACVNETSANIS